MKMKLFLFVYFCFNVGWKYISIAWEMSWVGWSDCFCKNCLQTFPAFFSDQSSRQKLNARGNLKFSLILRFEIGILHLFSVTSPQGGSRGARRYRKGNVCPFNRTIRSGLEWNYHFKNLKYANFDISICL